MKNNKNSGVVYGLCVPFLLLTLGGCSQIPVRNPFIGHQEAKLGPKPVVIESQSINPVKVAWTSGKLSAQERASKLRPMIADGVLYAADPKGKVVALNDQNGKNIWHIDTQHKLSSGPIATDNLVFVATQDAHILALDKQKGNTVWQTKVTSQVYAPPAASQGVVVVHAIDGSVSALNAQNGKMLWVVNQSTPSLTLRLSSAPVIVGDKVLVGLASGKLLALNIENGNIEWERVITVPRGRSELQRMVDISADPLVIDNTVYVITYQGKLAAVDIPSGAIEWERELSAYQNMAYINQTLFVTDNEYCIWAIDSVTGGTQWKQSALANRYITGAAVLGETVAVVDREGYVYRLAQESGQILSKIHLSGKYYQNPIAVNHELIFQSYQGKLAALMLQERA